MNVIAQANPQRKRPKKEERIYVRLEKSLAQRLYAAANQADLSTSDKVRRILDHALPHSP